MVRVGSIPLEMVNASKLGHALVVDEPVKGRTVKRCRGRDGSRENVSREAWGGGWTGLAPSL